MVLGYQFARGCISYLLQSKETEIPGLFNHLPNRLKS